MREIKLITQTILFISIQIANIHIHKYIQQKY